MRPVDRSEILPLGEYETIREWFRARVIAAKRARRIAVTEHMAVLFENRDTVLLQIQEMLRTERITSESGIAHEIETYNELVPADRQLSLTLFIQVPDRSERERLLVELVNIEEALSLEIDGKRFAAKGKREGAVPGRTTAVHYLKIDLSEEAATSLRRREAKVVMVVRHPGCEARQELSPEAIASLSEDLVG